MYNFSSFKSKLTEAEEWLSREYQSIRTGKATPQILDNVMVDSYGSKMPIKHVAAIAIEDAKTLRVTPWDKSQIRAIQSAVEQSNMGLSAAPDSNGFDRRAQDNVDKIDEREIGRRENYRAKRERKGLVGHSGKGKKRRNRRG